VYTPQKQQVFWTMFGVEANNSRARLSPSLATKEILVREPPRAPAEKTKNDPPGPHTCPLSLAVRNMWFLAYVARPTLPTPWHGFFRLFCWWLSSASNEAHPNNPVARIFSAVLFANEFCVQ
jgi:hypothetical protein